MFKKVHVIINPAAGQDEPILSYINTVFRKKKIAWDVSITHAAGDGTRLAKEAARKGYDLIAVYGGDGTIIEVAKTLYKTKMPLAIIPGGTANVMAKELRIPTASLDAIKLIASRRHKITAVDMGICNSEPFFLRLTLGDLANMTRKTTRKLKNRFGQLAYGISMIQHVGKEKANTYTLTLDNKKIAADGTSIMVTNSGNIGVEGTSLIPSISISDGYLDVILFRNTDLSTLASLASNILMQNKPDDVIAHWKAKKIKIVSAETQHLVHDDIITQTKTLNISILPKSVKIVVPK